MRAETFWSRGIVELEWSFWVRCKFELEDSRRWHSGKESAYRYRRCKRCRFHSWVGKIPWRGKKANCSSTLTWKIPWTVELDRLWFMGLQRVRHDWGTEHTHTHTHKDTCGPLEDCFQRWEEGSRAQRETVMPHARAEVVPKKERQEAHALLLTLPFTSALTHSASVHVGC